MSEEIAVADAVASVPQNRVALAKFDVVVTSVAILEDPIDKDLKHYHAFASVKSVPKGIRHFNVRSANISSLLYKKVIADLMNKAKTFHLNNRGIVILADKVSVRGKTISIDLGKGGGLMDGGRTDKIIQVHGESAPDNQFVCLQIRVGVPESKHVDMAKGLNSSHQVQIESLLNFGGAFDGMRKAVAGQPYENSISWEEGTKRSLPINVKQLLQMLSALNINIWPVKEYPMTKKAQLGIARYATEPICACSGSNDLMKVYEAHTDKFEDMFDLLPQIVLLRDYI
jgi:hypothetical protein